MRTLLNEQIDTAAADPQVAIKVALITMFGTVLVALIGGVVALVQLFVANQKLERNGRQLALVQGELTENGGSTTKDAAKSADKRLEVVEQRLDVGAARMDRIDSEVADVKAGVHLLLSAAGIDPEELQAS